MTTLNDPTLGELQDVHNGAYAPFRLWQTSRDLEGFGTLRIQFDVTGETITGVHRAALENFLQNKEAYKALALQALLEYYQRDIYPLWKDDPDFATIAPAVQTTKELEKLLSDPVLYIHWERVKQTSIGLGYEYTWDVEHGTGVLFRGGKLFGQGCKKSSAEMSEARASSCEKSIHDYASTCNNSV